MDFIELEKIMLDKGIRSLAGIARHLNTTPQAVSNWKRNQIPYRVIETIRSVEKADDSSKSNINIGYSIPSKDMRDDTINLSDILLIISEQLKVIVLSIFISVF